MMKQILKRAGALLLSLCLTLSVWGVLTLLPAAAATSGDYEYTVNEDNTATITKYTGSGGDVTIPDTLDGHVVTMIGYDSFESCTELTSVTIPDSVTTIGGGAFADCGSLTLVDISVSVTEIGVYAFRNCTGLTSINISDSVAEIGIGAFDYCTGVTLFTVGKDNPNYSSKDGVLFDKKQTKLIQYALGKSGSYTVPNSVTEIGYEAFEGCTGLTSVTIPNSVTEIGFGAFFYCTGLTSINIPNSVTEISDAFEGCTRLTSIVVGDDNPKYSSKDGVLFNKDQTELILCPGGKSGSYTIPNSVTWIGNNAFSGCAGLTSIVVDVNNPKYSSKDGVLFNKSQTELVLCPGGKSGNYTIPNGVTTIGFTVFRSCTELTSITIPDSVTAIDDLVFGGCTGLTSFTVGKDNPKYSSKDGVLFNKDQTELIQYPDGKSGSYAIPNSVSEIGWDAFMDCTKLTSVIIPDSVTTIGWSAFENCTGLTSVIIPDSVTEIGEGAFYGCTGLTSVTIGDSMTYIGMSTFYWCTGLTSVDIPDSVTRINGYAFYGCDNLTIYGKAGSYAEGFAMKNDIPFVAISRLSDDATGIVVQGITEAMPEGATLTAKQTASSEDAVTYEITLTQNGQIIQPTGEVTVKIPLPESMKDKRITVYRVEANGSRTNMNATVQNGCAVFTTDHFSQYLLEAKIMPADYTAVDAALEKVPEDLSVYTDETAQAVKDAVAAVVRDLPITEQAKVDAMAKAIEDAVAALKKAEKPTVLGDIDGDGKVSVTDALAILRMAVGLSTPVDNADIDGMNGVTVTDALAALRIAVGLA